MDFVGYFIMFVAGVMLATLFFIRKRNEPANEDPITQITKNLQTLMRRVEKLEEEKRSFTHNQEIKDALKLVRTEQENIRNLVSEALLNINTISLRLIATFRRKKKEVTQ